MKIFIGYDDREAVAYDVYTHSLRRRASCALQIVPLRHQQLRQSGRFTRPWAINGNGQYFCGIDGRVFSTQFSHSRFLTPILAREQGDSWALFTDCDFLALDDVAQLFNLADPRFAVQCVKHEYQKDGVKMDGMKQQSYSRKNWSSLMLFNVNHPSNAKLTEAAVNSWDGRELHNFSWLKDEEIGPLPGAWNWIPNHSTGTPSMVHFTEGMPFMPGYEGGPYSGHWFRELISVHHPSMSC